VRTKFVFIVGVSRSGTTLMRQILNSSDQIAISNENHFLGHLIPTEGVRYKFRQFGDLSDDDNVRKLVDYIYGGGLEKSFKRYRYWSYHWQWIIELVDREDFLQRVLASDRSERALFIIMMQVFADRQGKPIMGEKTPIHFRYVPTLMEWFPDGKVIHMVRDPRAIFVSELRRRRKEAITVPFKQLKRVDFLFKLYIVLQTTVVWFESVIRCLKYEKRYSDTYYVQRFEDLVTDPGKHVRQVCDFLGVDFQDKMLEQAVVSKGVKLGQAGFDAGAATRWQEHIDPWVNACFSFWLRKYFKKLGYID
jgi:hypothetical protein